MVVKLRKSDFGNILSNYSIGSYKSHLHLDWAQTNSVYKVRTSKGKYILKLFEGAEFKFIEFQDKISIFLKSTIPTPANILTRKGTFYAKYNNKIITIQREITGRHPERMTKNIILGCAYYLGKIDKELGKIKTKEYDCWGDHIFKKKEFSKISGFDIKKDYEETLQNLKKFNFAKFKKGYIHSDLHESNLLVNNNKIMGIIDWDDCHKDYYIYELAIFIGSCLFNKNGIKKDLLKKVIGQYERSIKLSKSEKEALYYLVKQRLLSLIRWSKEHGKGRGKWFYNKIRDYQNLKKISFQEFKALVI